MGSTSAPIEFTFSEHLGPLRTLCPGGYAMDATEYSEIDVFVCCPECGGIDRVTERVEIGSDGTIATWRCPTVTCDLPLTVKLAGWPEGTPL